MTQTSARRPPHRRHAYGSFSRRVLVPTELPCVWGCVTGSGGHCVRVTLVWRQSRDCFCLIWWVARFYVPPPPGHLELSQTSRRDGSSFSVRRTNSNFSDAMGGFMAARRTSPTRSYVRTSSSSSTTIAPLNGFMKARRVEGTLPPIEAPFMPPPSSAIKACIDSYTPRTTPQSAMLAGTTAANASGSSPTSTSAPTPWANAEFELPPSVKAFIQVAHASWSRRGSSAFARKRLPLSRSSKRSSRSNRRRRRRAKRPSPSRPRSPRRRRCSRRRRGTRTLRRCGRLLRRATRSSSA